jgi:phage terminase large subunit GpA-like protein
MNGGFGELWAPRNGEIPEWQEVQRLALPYRQTDVPTEVVFATTGIDVQKNRLVYTTRGWGYRQESWLLDQGEIWGETALDAVWLDLYDLLCQPLGSSKLFTRRAFIDAGFRPGKRSETAEHRVYDFARRHPRLVYATKGFDHRETPLSVKRLDVNAKGARSKFGIDLVRLDADFFKSWVHERLRWPEGQPGGWHLHADVTEDYCRQIVSEARVRKPSGGHAWVELSRNNHYFDCEALAYAAAYMLGVQRMGEGPRRPGPRPPLAPQRPHPDDPEVPIPVPTEPIPVPVPKTPARRPAARRVFQSSYL